MVNEKVEQQLVGRGVNVKLRNDGESCGDGEGMVVMGHGMHGDGG